MQSSLRTADGLKKDIYILIQIFGSEIFIGISENMCLKFIICRLWIIMGYLLFIQRCYSKV